MKGDVRVIEALNLVLVGELTAINQYFLHARMCKSWGFTKIAEILRKESISEMKHASDLTDRILFLEGMPNFQKLGKLRLGETVKEQLKSDLELELEAIPLLKKGIEICFETKDHTSRELLESILKEEETHAAWLEEQLGLVTILGEQIYLSQQM